MSAERLAEVADLAVGRQRKKAAANTMQAEAANATHHELVRQWIEEGTVDGYAPVFAAGAIHMPHDSGLYLPMPLEAVQVQFAARC